MATILTNIQNKKGQIFLISYTLVIFALMAIGIVFNSGISENLHARQAEGYARASNLAQAGINDALTFLSNQLSHYAAGYDSYQTADNKERVMFDKDYTLGGSHVYRMYVIPEGQTEPVYDMTIPDSKCNEDHLHKWCLPDPNETYSVKIIRNGTNPQFASECPSLLAYPNGTEYCHHLRDDQTSPAGWGMFKFFIESTGKIWSNGPGSTLKFQNIVQTVVTFLYFDRSLYWEYNSLTAHWETCWKNEPTCMLSGYQLGSDTISPLSSPIWFHGQDTNADGIIDYPLLPPGYWNVNLSLYLNNSLVNENFIINVNGRSEYTINDSFMPITLQNPPAYHFYPDLEYYGPHYTNDFIAHTELGGFSNLPHNGQWGQQWNPDGDTSTTADNIPNVSYKQDETKGTGQGSYAAAAFGRYTVFPAGNQSTLLADILCQAPANCPDTCNTKKCFRQGRDFTGDLLIRPRCIGVVCGDNPVKINAIYLQRVYGRGRYPVGTAPGSTSSGDLGLTKPTLPLIQVYKIERMNVGQ